MIIKEMKSPILVLFQLIHIKRNARLPAELLDLLEVRPAQREVRVLDAIRRLAQHVLEQVWMLVVVCLRDELGRVHAVVHRLVEPLAALRLRPRSRP